MWSKRLKDAFGLDEDVSCKLQTCERALGNLKDAGTSLAAFKDLSHVPNTRQLPLPASSFCTCFLVQRSPTALAPISSSSEVRRMPAR